MAIHGFNNSLYIEHAAPSNFSLFVNDDGPNLSPYILTTRFATLYGLAITPVFAVGVVANLAVIFVIAKTVPLQTTTNMHLIGLCITDCIHLASAPILLSVLILRDFPFSVFVCKTYMVAKGASWFAGTFLLTSMCVHQYLRVRNTHALHCLRRKHCALLTIILLWVLAVTLLSPVAIFSTKQERISVLDIRTGVNVDRTACVINWLPTNLSETNVTTGGGRRNGLPLLSRVFFAYTFLLGFVLPVLINIVAYFLLLRHVRLKHKRMLWRQGRSAHTVSSAVSSSVSFASADSDGIVLERPSSSKPFPTPKTAHFRKSERKRQKLPWKVALLVVTYVALWAPFWIQLIYLTFARELRLVTRPRWALIMQLLGYCNSAVNPILYAFTSSTFRRSLSKVFPLRCSCGWRFNVAYTGGGRRIRDKNAVKDEKECTLLCCCYLYRCVCD